MTGQRHALAAPYPRERPGTHCTGGWVDLRACVDRCGKCRPHRDSIPRPSSLWAVAIPTELPAHIFLDLNELNKIWRRIKIIKFPCKQISLSSSSILCRMPKHSSEHPAFRFPESALITEKRWPV